ncbi:response regulator [Stratiformator vulcanicus]|uniref:Alkaline phosphatase synthesis transcriptional regulatory protein PhoP n=1 Tax=Stratiformator vulcanicus TaxID=2527980 RepID=A0A517R403_9PLAN|nr:response regulator [Stratiformator vulcanicus]QDT38596.1 Alkaline phosphatase synthesis transcriptional regulatory protein PhoP [Stratiformator vulcanicus]
MQNDRSLLDIGSYKTVLVVDEPGNAKMLRSALEAEGFEPIIATNAGEARVLTRTREPAFIVTELVLPRETGFELCAYLKDKNDTLPIIILTEVDLDAARNLSIWCGADAYLTKPTDGKTIAATLHEIATIMALRVRKKTNVEGRIEFKCNRCGQQLSVKPDNAGRMVQCKGCQHMAKAPTMSMQSGGYWRQTEEEADGEADDGDGGGSKNRASFFCDLCGHMLDVFDANESGKVKCGDCGKQHLIPRWIIRQRKFFFSRPTEKQTETISFNPARYVTVRCGNCQTHFQFFPDREGTKATCPHCDTVQTSVSIKGSPLSRAALTSTGRMFVLKDGPMKGKRFLVPEDGEVVIGTGKGCNLRFPPMEGLAAKHAALRHVNGMVAVLPLDGQVTINEEATEHRHWIKPGEKLALGPLHMSLLGNVDLSENQLLKKSSKAAQKAGIEETGGADEFSGSSEIGEQAASILQLHWERLRKKPEPSDSAPKKKPAKIGPAAKAPDLNPTVAPPADAPAEKSSREDGPSLDSLTML